VPELTEQVRRAISWQAPDLLLVVVPAGAVVLSRVLLVAAAACLVG
jgi:hypothetical protein